MHKIILFLLFSLVAPATIYGQNDGREVPQNRNQLSFSPLVKKTSGAVVNIYTEKKIQVRNLSPFFTDPFFQHFFNDRAPLPESSERIENSLGSGVIIRPSGIIVTNQHVVEGSDFIKILFADKREFSAKIILADKKADIAFLKIDAEDEQIPHIDMADSDQLEVGDLVLAIGNPYGIGQTVTHGIVSAVARTAGSLNDYKYFIQTDAAINPGNSGGALINMDGKLVGINTAIFSKTGASNGIGFAIPTNMVISMLNSIERGNIKQGKILRPWLGISASKISKDIAEAIGMKIPSGIIVENVYPGSSAEKAGIKVGDIITSIDNHKIADESALGFRIDTYPIGKKAEFTIIRNSKPHLVEVVLHAPPKYDNKIISLRGKHPFNGTKVVALSPYLNEELGLDASLTGIIITVIDYNSYAASIGIKKGDIIISINNNKIHTVKQLQSSLASSTNKWLVLLQRGERVIRLLIEN